VRQLHTLKGLAATAGIVQLAEVARQSESQFKLNDPEAHRATIVNVRRAIGKHLPPLDALLVLLQAQLLGNAGTNPDGLQPKQRRACIEGLQHLREQLAIEDYNAMNTLAHIQKDFASAISDELEPLQEAMAQLDFEEALQKCQLLIVKMNS
jgi:HPt (histidine-containing phosphotransfer) domain-containing protein